MKKVITGMPRRVLAVAGAISLFFTSTAFASILGTEGGGWQTDMGAGAVYSNNVFVSDSVGRQTENLVEYTPNSESVPVVVNGSSVYGLRTISSAAKYMEDNNLRPLIGINADYFSGKTGIPMGYTVIDGKLLSKESGMQTAVGFREDGTAFIDTLGVDASLTHNGEKINIQYVNKWPQKGFSWVYMLDSNYSDTTKTNFNALYVVCSAEDGDLSLNSSMSLNVDEVYIYDGAIKIPDGKYVFVMDPDGDKTFFDFLANLAPGDKLTFANSVYGAEKNDWTTAKYALSSIGGRLLRDGAVVDGLAAGAAPRTAVGIKADGNVIFYTIDGRQKGYSYGVQLKTLANRLKELGCVDALNLDGGGSTAIGGIFPGSEGFVVTNKPSDGSERRCANYLFLQDLREQTGIVWYVDWAEVGNGNYMSGTTQQLTAKSVYDTGNYKMDGLTGVSYSVENSDGASATVTDTGLVSFSGTGHVSVTVTGERYAKTFDFETYESPDEVRVVNESTGDVVGELTVTEGGMINYDLEAGAFVNGVQLKANPDQFTWEIDGTLAEVDQNGVVSIKDDGSENATVRVTIGGTTAEIPIRVVKQASFDDIDNHWAADTIEIMARKKIINGFHEDGGKFFKPDDEITRIQFAAIVANALETDVDSYSGVNLNFTDADKIQPWALNYVKAMTDMGYITGRSDDGVTNYFDPESSITRAEAFTILSRVITTDAAAEINFADIGDIPQWSMTAFEKLAALGVIQGYEDNTIKPQRTISRGEAAVIVDKSSIGSK